MIFKDNEFYELSLPTKYNDKKISLKKQNFLAIDKNGDTVCVDVKSYIVDSHGGGYYDYYFELSDLNGDKLDLIKGHLPIKVMGCLIEEVIYRDPMSLSHYEAWERSQRPDLKELMNALNDQKQHSKTIGDALIIAIGCLSKFDGGIEHFEKSSSYLGKFDHFINEANNG